MGTVICPCCGAEMVPSRETEDRVFLKCNSCSMTEVRLKQR